jgi:hypothetical protein
LAGPTPRCTCRAEIRALVTRPSTAENAGMRLRLASLLLVAACGLVPPDPIGFRTYVLKDTSAVDAFSVVNDVTRKFALDHWGGVFISSDATARNFKLGPVEDGTRRMTLYVHVDPAGADSNVEMFAVVETLKSEAGKIGWVEPMQDIPLQEQLYQAYVDALVARQGAAH